MNGISNNDGLGINANNGTTNNGNTANGNDVPDPVADPLSQCDAATLCAAPETQLPDPPLLPCGQTLNIPATFTLRHPLDCPTGDALKIAANDVTLNLGDHRVSGGSGIWSDAGVAVVSPGITRVTIVGGILADSGNGVRIADTTKTRLDGVLLARSVGAGAALYRTNSNVFDGGGSIDNTADGVFIRDGDLNRIDGMTIAANAANGVSLVKTSSDPAILTDRSSQNRIQNNEILGNAVAGIVLADSNNNVINLNSVVGSETVGASIAGSVTGSPKNRLANNTFTGNENVGVQIEGIGGSSLNRLTANKISASVAGVLLRDPKTTRTVLVQNLFLSNNQFGAIVQLGAVRTVFVRNTANNNGLNGIFFSGVVAGNVVKNTTNRNGFTSTTDDDVGLGIFADSGGKGCGNRAAENDDPDQIDPRKFKLKCKPKK